MLFSSLFPAVQNRFDSRRTFSPSRVSSAWRLAASGALVASVLAAMPSMGQRAQFSGTAVPVGSGFNNPSGVAVDGKGNVYVADHSNNAVKEIVAAGGYTTVNILGSGFSHPSGVAVDAKGNVFVAEYSSNAVKGIFAWGGRNTVSTLGVSTAEASTLNIGFNSPQGVAVDGKGNVYVADTYNSSVREILAAGGYTTVNTLGSGFHYPSGVAVDASGNVFVADTGNNAVKEIVAAGGYATVNTLGSGFNYPSGVAVDRNGNIFVADTGNNAVKEIVSTGGYTTVDTVDGGFSRPTGVAVDAQGHVFVADQGNDEVKELDYSDPPSLRFSSTNVGASSSSQSVRLTNTGSAALLITGIALTGVDASSFEVGNSCGTSLAVGASCTIRGHFAPTTAGGMKAAITINDNAANSPQSISMDGNGVDPVASLSANTLSYGSVTVNTPGLSQPVTLTNTGNSLLSISSIVVTGTDPSSFVFLNNCGASLAVGASCTIHGHFQPTGPGPLSAAVTLTDNAIDSPQSIALSGNGMAATTPITLSATSLLPGSTATNLLFGSVDVGLWSPSQWVIVTNTTNVAVPITSIAVTGTGATAFDFANSCGSSLAVGAQCYIHGHFAPTASGPVTAAVTVAYSGGGSPQSIALSGTGVVPVTLSATSLSYGSVVANTPSQSQAVTLTNTGISVLSITSIAVTGTDASSFVFANTCGSSLAIGANCTIHGHFQPSATGPFSAAVTITDDAYGSPQSIALSGSGVAATTPITLSATSLLPGSTPTELLFGSVEVGMWSPSQWVIVTNTTNVAVPITSIGVSGTDASSFEFADSCGVSLAVGAQCFIHGHFTPITGGPLTAAVIVAYSGSGSPQSIALSGTGVVPPVTLSATSISYAPTAVDAESGSQSVTMTNTGTATLSITSIAVTGGDASSFVFGNTCGTSLVVGASCSIHGHFAPAATGALTAAVTITDSAAGSPQSIALSGTGQ